MYSEQHRLRGGAEPRPFDFIRVEAPWADSRPSQPENRIVDGTEWELLERPASRQNILHLERTPVAKGPIFSTLGRAVRAGGFETGASILYVEPQETQAVYSWDASKERYRSRLRFQSCEVNYDLPLTDHYFNQVLRQRGEGIYRLDQLGCRAPHGLRLIVTLGEPFHGWCYKMVSGILPRRTVTLMQNAATSRFPFEERTDFNHPVARFRAAMGGA